MPNFDKIQKVRPAENSVKVDDLKVELYSLASKKLSIDVLEGKLKKDKGSLIEQVFTKCQENSLFSEVQSGDLIHKELILSGPPGSFSIKVQLQSSSENVEVNPYAVDFLRKKLKEKAEPYIVKTESVPMRALESLVLQKLLTKEEVDSLLLKSPGASKRIIQKLKK